MATTKERINEVKLRYGPMQPHPLSQMRTKLVWEGKYDEYNTRRPHSALGYRPPAPLASSPRDRPNPVLQPLAVL